MKTKIKRDYQSTASSAETGHPDVQIRITISLLIFQLAAGAGALLVEGRPEQKRRGTGRSRRAGGPRDPLTSSATCPVRCYSPTPMHLSALQAKRYSGLGMVTEAAEHGDAYPSDSKLRSPQLVGRC